MAMMEAVIERCAGIDVGRKFVVVCTMIGEANAVPQYKIRKFLHPQPSTGAVTKVAAEHRIVLEADFPRIRRRKATGSAGQFATREESARA
jgi:hypothetical protein